MIGPAMCEENVIERSRSILQREITVDPVPEHLTAPAARMKLMKSPFSMANRYWKSSIA
jgi:hypothetical protein